MFGMLSERGRTPTPPKGKQPQHSLAQTYAKELLSIVFLTRERKLFLCTDVDINLYLKCIYVCVCVGCVRNVEIVYIYIYYVRVKSLRSKIFLEIRKSFGKVNAWRKT